MKELPNLNDLTRMDDFLHLLQFMIKLAEDPASKQQMLRRVVADRHNYTDPNTEEARKKPKFV